MPQTLPSPAQPAKTTSRDDEIDLSALVRAMWRTRRLVLAAATLAALALVAAAALTRLGLPSTHTFQTAVRFVFPGAEQGRYPNGAAFAVGDLLLPAVVERVYRQNQLDQYGIDLRSFIAALAVEPYAPSMDVIKARYKARLAETRPNFDKLTFTERQWIEQEMATELAAANSSAARLRLVLTGQLPFAPQFAEKLLLDIVRDWADYSIEQRGVLELPGAVFARDRIDPALMRDYEPVVVVEMLYQQIERQTRKLEKLAEVAGSSALADSESGHSLHSLLQAWQTLDQYRQPDIARLVRSQSDRDKALSALNSRIDRLTQSENALLRRADAIQGSLALYRNRAAAGAPAAGGSAAPPASGDASLDRAVDAAKRQETDLSYERSLVDRYLDLRNQAAEIATRRERVTRLAERVGTVTVPAPGPDNDAGAAAQRELQKLIETVNEMTGTGARLSSALGRSRLLGEGQLAVGLPLGASETSSSHHPVLNRGLALTVVLTSLGAGLLAMFAGLLWQRLGPNARTAPGV